MGIPAFERRRVYGVPVTNCSVQHVIRTMHENIAGARVPAYISITNTEAMYHARRSPEHLRYIEGARLSLCDGIGVVAAGLASGARIRRLNGPVLMLECCAAGAGRGWRHFFYGGKPGVTELLCERLCRRFPGLTVAGTYCPPFRELTPDEDNEAAELISRSRPDIVWVGLGLPKQERWIASHIGVLAAPWMVGVGAAFDYHAGTARWAPAPVRSMGLEWLYRLAHEPRMFVRNVRSLHFVVEAAAAGIASRIAGL